MELIKYDAACRAVAELKSIDECKEFVSRAQAARAYAKQAQNRDLEIDACEIRVRAERRLGEILVQLKKDGVAAVQGVRDHTARGGPRKVFTLQEIGVERTTSAISQRLAMLPVDRFQSELENWRAKAPSATRLETPLQAYRVPSVRGERQKAAARAGRSKIDSRDIFDGYRSPDGRRIADWRIGELRRLKDIAQRMLRCAEILQSEMPVANADPLATVEMIFRREALERILKDIWAEGPVDPGNCGINQPRIDASRERRRRNCERCGSEFLMRNPSGKGRSGKSNEGRFCSRDCAHKAARKPKH